MAYKNKYDAAKWRLAHKEDKKRYDKRNSQKPSVRDRSKAKRQERLEALQKYVVDYLLQHPCVDCGETDIVVLEFDHIEAKEIGISKAVSGVWGLKKLQTEIAKCEVRCANDHRRKTARDFKYYRGLVK